MTLTPALDTANPIEWHKLTGHQQALAASLACYVSAEDIILSRKRFLATVVSRIQDDLKYDTQ